MGAVSGPVYLDTSVLVKLYVREAESTELGRTLDGRQDLLLSELTITEFVSAVCRRTREARLTQRQATSLCRALLEDADAGQFVRLTLAPETHRSAERLLLAPPTDSLRAADSLHLALALSSEARTLATFDGRLRQAAAAQGLALLPG